MTYIAPDVTPENQELFIDLGYRRLMGAILIQALIDARAGSQEAINWLKEEGNHFLFALGMDDIDVNSRIFFAGKEGWVINIPRIERSKLDGSVRAI